MIEAAIPLVPEGPLPANEVLSRSMITSLDKVPDETKARLQAILARFM